MRMLTHNSMKFRRVSNDQGATLVAPKPRRADEMRTEFCVRQIESVKVRTSLMFLTLHFLLAALFATSNTLAQENSRIALEAGRVIVSADEEIADAIILIEEGRIKQIAPRAQVNVPAGFRRVQRANAVVMPGMMDLQSAVGAGSDRRETEDVIDFDSRVHEVFDPTDAKFAALRAAGVTTVVVSPEPENVISGYSVIAKTSGSLEAVFVKEGPLVISLNDSATAQRQFPTSFLGVRDVLRRVLDEARAENRADSVLGQVVRGKRPAFVHATTARQLTTALEFRETLGLNGTLVGGGEARDVLDVMRGKGILLALPALDFDSSKPTLKLIKDLDAAGVKMAFFAQTPQRPADVLRLSAALAHRAGLSRSVALGTIHLAPALMAGVDQRVGTLNVGRDADFVVLDGDPLSLTTSVKETWIQGVRVYSKTTHGESVK